VVVGVGLSAVDASRGVGHEDAGIMSEWRHVVWYRDGTDLTRATVVMGDERVQSARTRCQGRAKMLSSFGSNNSQTS
jgi:hypothetical protein